MRALQLALVAITIHTNTVEKTVNAHEVPILKLLHGDDDRCVVLEENAGTVGMELSNDEEYARLIQVYGKSSDIVRHVYRNAKELGEEIGNEEFIPLEAGEAEDAPVVAKAVAKPAAKKAVKKAPKRA
jgi:hypothetical protein